MNARTQLPRRTFLRGLGTLMALPWLEAMSPLARAATAAPPRRLGFVYIPNGANMADWTPRKTGVDFDLPYILEPLAPHRQHLQVISGLAHDKARPNGDGPGDHARASASFLTGCQARKTAGADIRAGVSVDQIAAERIGRRTRLPSLELGCDKGRSAGECDSGYSCAYQFNIAWKTESMPLPPEVNPRSVFDRLFASDDANESAARRAARRAERASVLDFVLEDARGLQKQLGPGDRRKLDEYFTAVRELEQRIQHAENYAAVHTDMARPAGVPPEYPEHLRIMYDLLALAYQTDSTRIATFLVSHDGNNRPYPFVGVSDGHHDLSHHGNDAAKKQKIAKINRFHLEQFARFVGRLKDTREGDGSLLDHCMIVYGGAIGDGNAHNHDDLPILLVGGGGGTLQPGRHMKLADETPMTNLYLALLDRMSVPAERVGDSTGKLAEV